MLKIMRQKLKRPLAECYMGASMIVILIVKIYMRQTIISVVVSA